MMQLVYLFNWIKTGIKLEDFLQVENDLVSHANLQGGQPSPHESHGFGEDDNK